ncbi:MAG TPA: BON domain-containing protein, partial [Blastocatellia bacterium]|nr:BON domain-containing protein [Blastocatellia bacterium]
YSSGRQQEERGFFDRVGDEVRSWFEGEDTERRRNRIDEEEYGGGYGRYERQGYDEPGWRGTDYERQDRYEQEHRYGATTQEPGWRGYGRRGYESYRQQETGGYPIERQRSYEPRRHGQPSRESLYGREYEGYEPREGRYTGRPGQQQVGAVSYTDVSRMPGRFAGRGPKNYQRSDERIREDINERLTEHGQIDATDIEVDVNNGQVILRGAVRTRYEKRLAEDVADSVSGVRDVQNQIRVMEAGLSERARIETQAPPQQAQTGETAAQPGQRSRTTTTRPS